MMKVWDSEQLKEGDSKRTLVLLALADWANEDGWCWPAMKSVAQRARCSEATARRIIQHLERRGLVEIEPHRGRNHTNRYRITMEVKEVKFGLVDPDVKPSNVCEVLAPEHGDRKPCNSDTENLANRDENLSKRALKPSTAVIPEPSRTVNKNRHENHQSAFALPDWVPEELWDDWFEWRKRNKYPVTERVKAQCVAKLEQFRNRGHPPAAVLELALERGWRGLFEPRGNENGAGNKAEQRRDANIAAASGAKAILRRMADRAADPTG